MKSVLVLRHVVFEDLGAILPILERRGLRIDYFDVGVDAFFDVSPLNHQLVIVLGGPISAYETDNYPFLSAEITWLRARIIDELPTLGIGLGAQLIAAALHAKVYPGNAKEIGWAPLSKGMHSATLPALDTLIETQAPVLHWHGDTFDLPSGARHLAASEHYKNQAFSWGEHCLALQFHPEFNPKKLEQWLIARALEVSNTSGISLAQLRDDTVRYGEQSKKMAEQFLRDWLNGILKTPAALVRSNIARVKPGKANKQVAAIGID